MKTQELKPCPFCGHQLTIRGLPYTLGTNPKYLSALEQHPYLAMKLDDPAAKWRRIRCPYCGVRGFWVIGNDAAVKAWNTRKKPRS